jgi:hypothetical protein
MSAIKMYAPSPVKNGWAASKEISDVTGRRFPPAGRGILVQNGSQDRAHGNAGKLGQYAQEDQAYRAKTKKEIKAPLALAQ